MSFVFSDMMTSQQKELKLKPEIIIKHDAIITPKPMPLLYPCNDNSSNISDFSSWSYFKNRDRKKISNIASSKLWSKEMVSKLKPDAKIKVHRSLPPVKTTKGQKNREKFIYDTYNMDELCSQANADYDQSSLASSMAIGNIITFKRSKYVDNTSVEASSPQPPAKRLS
jgi:hypothetical protein